jgi:DNA-binding LytR/AlgR family response regulator
MKVIIIEDEPLAASRLKMLFREAIPTLLFNNVPFNTEESIEFLDAYPGTEKLAQSYKSRFTAKSGSKMFFVETHNIAYFYAVGKLVYLVTLDGKKLMVKYTLGKLHGLLDPRFFFRLNRNMICGIRSIKEVRIYLNSRLKIHLLAGTQTDQAIVSRERVTAFKAWAEM